MKVIIIGGGAVGLCCAYYLALSDCHVIVIDKGKFSDGCSFGNAGLIDPSQVFPLAAPGVIAKALKWMLDAKSPFYIRPRLDLNLLTWMWRFYKNATVDNVQRAIPFYKSISAFSQQLHQDLATDCGFTLSHNGLLIVYQSLEAQKAELQLAETIDRHNLPVQTCSSQQVKAMLPNVQIESRGGVYYPQDMHASPNQFMSKLQQKLISLGVEFVSNQTVRKFILQSNQIQGIQTKEKTYSADIFVISAGVWSNGLVKALGVNLPLQAGKGYHLEIQPQNKPTMPLLLSEKKVAITPMNEGLRLAGTMEFSGLNHNINPKRIQGITDCVKKYFPGYADLLESRDASWCGLRPCTPDGLPYLGKVPGWDNSYIATGHAMRGFSLAPASGKLISEQILNRSLSLDIALMNPNRFKKAK